jgi:putative acetyltransferase
MNASNSRPLPLAGTPDIVLLHPVDDAELAATRRLFHEYATALGVDLGFQNFEEEVLGLPGEYAEPRGMLLLALIEPSAREDDGSREASPEPLDPAVSIDSGDPRPSDAPAADDLLPLDGGRKARPAGCCALRPLDNADYPNAAEMKRLYVRPGFRGLGLGRHLAEAILDAARGAGYACVLLDTLDDMESARTLYEDLGFEEVPPYYHNPVAGSHYLKVDL